MGRLGSSQVVVCCGVPWCAVAAQDRRLPRHVPSCPFLLMLLLLCGRGQTLPPRAGFRVSTQGTRRTSCPSGPNRLQARPFPSCFLRAHGQALSLPARAPTQEGFLCSQNFLSFTEPMAHPAGSCLLQGLLVHSLPRFPACPQLPRSVHWASPFPLPRFPTARPGSPRTAQPLSPGAARAAASCSPQLSWYLTDGLLVLVLVLVLVLMLPVLACCSCHLCWPRTRWVGLGFFARTGLARAWHAARHAFPHPALHRPFFSRLLRSLSRPQGRGGRREAWQLAGTWFRASSPRRCPGLCALLPLHAHSRCHALALINNPPPSGPLTSSAGQGLCLRPQPRPCGSRAVSALLSSRSSVLFPISSAVPMLCWVPPVAFPSPAFQQLLGQLPPHAGPGPTPPALAARGRAGHEGSSPAWLGSQRAASTARSQQLGCGCAAGLVLPGACQGLPPGSAPHRAPERPQQDGDGAQQGCVQASAPPSHMEEGVITSSSRG